jgi:alkylhydroperoxidase family enzyme
VFLPSLFSHRPDGSNRWADGVRAAEASGAAYVPGIWRLFAWKPALAKHLAGLAQEVLRGPSELSPGFRELIASYVSTRNHCLF